MHVASIVIQHISTSQFTLDTRAFVQSLPPPPQTLQDIQNFTAEHLFNLVSKPSLTNAEIFLQEIVRDLQALRKFSYVTTEIGYLVGIIYALEEHIRLEIFIHDIHLAAL